MEEKMPKELFKFEYFYHCKQLGERKPVPFIAVNLSWIACNPCRKCFIRVFPLKTWKVFSIIYCLAINTYTIIRALNALLKSRNY